MSMAATATAGLMPITLETFSAPAFPLPNRLMSCPNRRLTTT